MTTTVCVQHYMGKWFLILQRKTAISPFYTFKEYSKRKYSVTPRQRHSTADLVQTGTSQGTRSQNAIPPQEKKSTAPKLPAMPMDTVTSILIYSIVEIVLQYAMDILILLYMV